MRKSMSLSEREMTIAIAEFLHQRAFCTREEAETIEVHYTVNQGDGPNRPGGGVTAHATVEVKV